MKKWSYRLALTVLSACSFVFTPSFTEAGPYDSYDPGCCWDPCSFGGFEVGAEFLWWKPCFDHADFAISQDIMDGDEVNGDEHFRNKTLCPKWEPGVKLWAYKPSIFCGSCGLGASFIGIWSTHDRHHRHDGGVTIPGSTLPELLWDRVGCRWRGHYYDYDVLLSYPCCCGDCSVIRPFFGFAGFNICQEMRWRARNEVANPGPDELIPRSKTRWCSDLNAYGLRVGSEYECKLADCLKVYGRFSISLVTGRPDTKHHDRTWNIPLTAMAVTGQVEDENSEEEENSKQVDGIGNHHFRDDECYRIFPGYRLAAGAVYETCFCNTDISFRLGYEFIQWHNLPHHRRFIENGNPNTTGSSDRTFGWQGLTAGVAVCF